MDADESCQIAIRWENTEEDLAVLDLYGKDTLSIVYNKLIGARPELSGTDLSFVHDKVPIRQELWEIIKVSKVPDVLYIKEGTFDFVRRMDEQKEMIGIKEFHSDRDETISVSVNDSVLVTQYGFGATWWYGVNSSTNAKGWFPNDCVGDIYETKSTNT